jgi:membrane protein YdbS with pleckstrin-like domain
MPVALLLCVPVLGIVVMAAFSLDRSSLIVAAFSELAFVVFYAARVLAQRYRVRVWRPPAMDKKKKKKKKKTPTSTTIPIEPPV